MTCIADKPVYGKPPRENTSNMRTPKAQMSFALVSMRVAKTSGAIHRTLGWNVSSD